MSNSPKYAIMVPLEHDWLYITEGDSKFQMRVKTFDTYEEAKEFAEPWLFYKIEEYYGDK